MKKLTFILFAFAFTSLKAQVGINTTSPNAQLEIKSSDQTNPANNDGILIPKVDAFPAINPTIVQDGMMVYLTTDVGANLKGFYYWDNANSVWKSISGNKGWSLTGNTGTNVSTNFIGTTDNVGLKFKVNNALAGYIDPVLYNTSFGQVSANAMTTGDRNVAFGHQSLFSNTDGYYNSAVGFQSLYSNTTGHDNSAFGSSSLVLNTIGSRNSALGMGALNYNTTGSDNTSVGYYSLLSNTTSNANTAVGSFSLSSNTTGYYNSALGYKSLASNTTGSDNQAFGTGSLAFNTTGSRNTAIGGFSLNFNTTGVDNTAVGYFSMLNNTTGYLNSAFGVSSLQYNISGYNNSAFGYRSLANNINGNSNSAFGLSSLQNNTTGIYNSAFGSNSLNNNTIGEGNCSFGLLSTRNSTTGSYNCGFGTRSLFNNDTGSGNGGYGQEANPTTTTGWNNIGVGFHTLGNIDIAGFYLNGNQIGYDNIAFGLFAGDRIGYNCNQAAFIGPFTNVITNNTNVSNSTAVGNGALVFQNNMMRFGNSAVTRIEAQVGLTVVSDGRYKFNVKEEVKGLDFIKKLRPVMYQYDTEKMDRKWMNVEFDTMVKHNPQLLKDYQKSRNIRYSGFIAQEVEQAAKDAHYAFSGLSKPENEQDHYGLDYAVFVVPLVKSIQEQQIQIEALEKEKRELQRQIENNADENKKLQTQIKLLEKRFAELENLVKTP